MKFLTQWRAMVSKEAVPTLEQRGLAPPVPSADQTILLALRSMTDETALLQSMQLLLPFHVANTAALSTQDVLTGSEEVAFAKAQRMLAAVRANNRVSPGVLATVESNFKRLQQVVWKPGKRTS
jgi:hypothetical protein